MSRPKKYPIILSDADILRLKTVIANKDCSKTVRSRCRILLDLDENKGKDLTHEQCAKVNGISAATVTNVVRLFHNEGIESVITLNRNENSNNGRYRSVRCTEEKAFQIACGFSPAGRPGWMLRFIGAPARIELETIQPSYTTYWRIPSRQNTEFIADMEDVLAAYSMPYNPKYPVVCMGEEIYRLSDEEGKPKDNCCVFVFTEPLIGKRHISVRAHRTAYDWAEEIKYITDVMYPDAEKIILVLDNTNTHAAASLYKSYAPEEAAGIVKRLEIHHTPKGGSWLNVAEIELYAMIRACLSRRINSIEKVSKELKGWEFEYSKKEARVQWKLNVCSARSRMAALYPKIDAQ